MAEFVLIEKKEESKQESSPFNIEDRILFMKSKCILMEDLLSYTEVFDSKEVTELTSEGRWGLVYLFRDCADMFDQVNNELVGQVFDEVSRARNSYDSILRSGYPYREGHPADHLNDLCQRVSNLLTVIDEKGKALKQLKMEIIQARHEIIETGITNQTNTQEG